MKTVYGWLLELPQPYSDKAIKNMRNTYPYLYNGEAVNSMSEALTKAFYFTNTPEGEDFWIGVWYHCRSKEPMGFWMTLYFKLFKRPILPSIS